MSSESVADDAPAVLVLVGDLDAVTVPEWRRRGEELLQADGVTALVVDMQRLDTIDSSGLGLLVHLQGHAHDRGVAVTLQAVPPRALALLTRTGLDQVFEYTVAG